MGLLKDVSPFGRGSFVCVHHGLLESTRNVASNLRRRMGTETLSSGRGVHTWLLYTLIMSLLCYIAIDFSVYHNDLRVLSCLCNYPFASASSRLRTEIDQLQTETESCKSREAHYETGGQSVKREDPWQQIKWIGQPASCKVKGHLIEKLDDENNFRRGFALKFVEDVEDKTHILPWLLASKVDLNRRKRRVYLDFGSNRFTTSVRWFLRMYPCDFTEIHAFEANPRSWRQPKQGFDEASNLESISSNFSIRVKQKPGVPQWMLDRIKIHYKFVADEDDEQKRRVNITRFMKEELKLKAADTVVVKMDIEGSEWPILRRWMEDPEMPQIVDELFVELHYAHPSMSGYGWSNFEPIKREDAKRLLADLRWRGFYAHAWP